MNAEQLLELLFIAADAKTDEEKARVAWRASDYMWWEFPRYQFRICRTFNNLCQDQKWKRVTLWSQEEKEEYLARYKELKARE